MSDKKTKKASAYNPNSIHSKAKEKESKRDPYYINHNEAAVSVRPKSRNYGYRPDVDYI